MYYGWFWTISLLGSLLLLAGGGLTAAGVPIARWRHERRHQANRRRISP